MTETPDANAEQPVIELNFVPSWARKPPAERSYESDGRPDTPRREREREPRDFRDRPRGNRDRGPRQGGGRGGPRDSAPAFAESREEQADSRLAFVEVAFLPERRGMAPLAHRLARSVRAFSLFEVASLFLSKPEFYAIRLSLTNEAPADFALYQCSECRAVFFEREAAAVHGFAAHFEKACRKEERQVDPPKGNFVCVARCGLSGVLLGPPNHHGFNDRVTELHRTRFAHLPFETYRQKIENIHDAALIEQWKEEMRRQVIYHFGEGDKTVSFERFADADAWFREHRLAGMIRESRQAIMPGALVESLEDASLRKLILDERQRETRFPLKLSITLRLAFRHLGLHTFKAGDGHTFITAVAPSAMDPNHAVPGIREVLDYVTAHPGSTVQEMFAALRPPVPDAPAPSEPPRDVATQLRWLVEKGHVIEFSDGRLAVPQERVKVQAALRPSHGGRDRH